jgi:hypothetical protein
MPEHDGFEHELPNGDILIVDATVTDPRVIEAFAVVKQSLREKAERTYAELRAAA